VSNLGLRCAVIVVLTVLLQSAAFSDATVLGVSIDLTPLVAAFAGLLGGSIAGACVGFSLGMLIDLALVQTLGVSALLLVGIGYAAGRLRELRDPAHTMVPLAVGAAAALLYAVGFSLIQIMLGVGAPMSYLVFRDIVALTLLDAVMALPVYAVMRRALRGALPDDTRRRRRRAYTTGGLSPLTTSKR
jgi:rod shape-determining protein MreD